MYQHKFFYGKKHATASLVYPAAFEVGRGKLKASIHLTEDVMFKKLSTAIFLFIAIAAKADEGQKVASKVQKVTVFLRGAQVSRTAQVSINAGTSDLVFDGISPGIDVNSIQVHANGEFTVLSVKSEINYSEALKSAKAKQIEDLRALQKGIRDKTDMLSNMISIYQTEEAVLAKNQFVRPENQNLDVAKLKLALDFQTERLTSLRQKERLINNQVTALNDEFQKYEDQINIINQQEDVSSANIIVTVASKIALQSAFTLSYVVGNASWYPSYDIRAKNVNSPVTIVYKANISQKSGEDWRNVKLSLSTGNPSVNNVKQELNPYFVNFTPKYEKNYSQSTGSVSSLSEVAVVGYSSRNKEYTFPVQVNMVENQTNVEFNIDNPYSIKDDGKVCQVEINQVATNASYQYFVVPKLSTDVFLTARITDWNKFNFLSGEANLYYEGTYVGKSKIDTRGTNDTLSLPLGVDKNILVKRTLEKGFVDRSGSNAKETRNWLIEVKNRKNQKVNLLVEDQVPVSQNALVIVDVQNTSGAKPDDATGKLSWNFLLNSQDDKKVQLKYLVKYPKDQSVIVQ
ncbi:DUF4139 domain-containing protein [Mucilaginibacter flavus]|uniref:DUF4139 domain-containing protein n=1 Tax=Mucilaginibacter flavus TaxID=931504 RepID=UPI0025B2FAFF|nr:DUF4139 domain-containing protein [Mucilaginibacter flavus]MDN3581332.1 DUF4139 domain-containing protein [Mucilaginibacter flavus]